MDDQFLEGRLPAKRISCCPVPFVHNSPGRAVTSSNLLFSYDPKAVCNRQVNVGMERNSSFVVVDDRDLEKNVRLSQEEQNDEEGSEQGICHHAYPFEFRRCSRSLVSSFSFHGIVCSPLITSRLALTGLLIVLLTVMTVFTWVFTSANVQQSVTSIAADYRHELLSHIDDTLGDSLQSINAVPASLARFLGSQNLSIESSFASLEEQVRPALFFAFSLLGRKAHVSFFARSGFFFTYGVDASGTFLAYANTSYLLTSFDTNSSHGEVPLKKGDKLVNNQPLYRWYYQRIDDDSGAPMGKPFLRSTPTAYWETEPLKSFLNGRYGNAVLAPAAGSSRDLLLTFLTSVYSSSSADSGGFVSVGTPLTQISRMLDQFDLRGGAAYVTMADGRLVAASGAFTKTKTDNLNDATQGLFFAGQSNNTVVAATAEYLNSHLPGILALTNDSFTANVEVDGVRYLIDSAPIHLSKVPLVCVVVIPHSSIWGMAEKRRHITLAVLVALATCMGLVGCFFVILLTKGLSNEMRLKAALIKQLEETKSAETRSSQKSLVFANMSHDLRTPLAAILGLIDLCLSDAAESSELETNLLQMKSCSSNLLGILNTILDMSKIEAGKLSLQESEFDLVSALEEVVDTFSVVGFTKGIEVDLDLSDGSVEKVSCVIGDVGRVKQIMANLLSNGVKFTSEGHVILRAWVNPLNSSSETPPLSYKGRYVSWPWSQLIKSSSRHKTLCKLISHLSEQNHGQHDYVQIEFEVDDSGRGIPKERWKSVFENFVQVESSGPRSYDGTGLGLGIVRSMVRLMGGDICIIDKDGPGEPGTQFRFNLMFKCNKQKPVLGDMKIYGQGLSHEDTCTIQDTFGVNSTSVPSRWQTNPVATSEIFGAVTESGTLSPIAMEAVHVLLAVKGDGARKIVKKWMERRGVQVWTINDWQEFAPTVEQIIEGMHVGTHLNSGRLEPMSPDQHVCDSWIDDFETHSVGKSRISIDRSLHQHSSRGAGSPRQTMGLNRSDHEARAYLLIVVDVSMVTAVSEALCSDIEDMLLETDKLMPHKLVWLINPNTPSLDIQFLKSQSSVCNLILHKPLYTSRLQCIWQLLEELVGKRLQEYKSEVRHLSPEYRLNTLHLDAANTLYTSLSCMNTFRERTPPKASMHVNCQNRDCRGSMLPCVGTTDQGLCQTADGSLTSETDLEQQKALSTSVEQSKLQCSSERKLPKLRRHSKEIPTNFRNALSSMHILVAEDNLILQRLTMTQLIRLGATVECVNNGAEAVRLVLDNLYKNKVPCTHSETLQGEDHQELSKSNMKQPFDLVVMDCEMPVLNGYEATQRIRSEESRYGIRTPVIALTAHAMAQDEKKCIEAGMDFYLTKPLSTDALLDVVNRLRGEKKP